MNRSRYYSATVEFFNSDSRVANQFPEPRLASTSKDYALPREVERDGLEYLHEGEADQCYSGLGESAVHTKRHVVGFCRTDLHVFQAVHVHLDLIPDDMYISLSEPVTRLESKRTCYVRRDDAPSGPSVNQGFNVYLAGHGGERYIPDYRPALCQQVGHQWRFAGNRRANHSLESEGREFLTLRPRVSDIQRLWMGQL